MKAILGDDAPVQDVVGAVTEVDNTHRVVADAVARPVWPALVQGPLNTEPYLESERVCLLFTLTLDRPLS